MRELAVRLFAQFLRSPLNLLKYPVQVQSSTRHARLACVLSSAHYLGTEHFCYVTVVDCIEELATVE